jgi:hypothetical protein
MTSLQTRIKQIPANDGYYITVATGARGSFYANVGTDSAPSLTIGPLISSMSSSGQAVSSIVNAAGAIFRDMGKTLTSSGRVFRKVQLLVSSATTEGVGGAAATVALPVDYLTGYIELPGTGGMSSGSNNYTPVARLG